MLDVKNATFGQLQNNCYLITDEKSGESALVDCTDSKDKMLSFIDGKNIKYILLTHGHFDHIGGVDKIRQITGAKVVISKEDEIMLSSSRKSLAAFSHIHQIPTAPDITVTDGDVITLGDTKLTVMLTPGHTKGGVCYVAEDCIFTGDTLFFCSCGRTDFPGGSYDEILKSLHRISSLKGNLKVYPGHDRESNLDFERQNNPYMK